MKQKKYWNPAFFTLVQFGQQGKGQLTLADVSYQMVGLCDENKPIATASLEELGCTYEAGTS